MATRISAYVKPYVLPERDRHVVSRFSFGANEELVTAVRAAKGADRWFATQLSPGKVADTAGNAVVGWFPRLKHAPATAWAEVKAGKASAWDYGLQLTAYTLARKIVTTRQVQEVMADFWSNLLYIPAYEDRSFPWRYHYDTGIRGRSLTTYRQLLQFAVVHPAMSGWLTNDDNTKRGINENLGRELLELYTVGRPAGYTEDDVRDTARLLTGFRVKVFDGYASSYAPEHHWTGPVSILGFEHPNSDPDGRAAVQALLAHLASHPATATRIAHRLCRRFVSDNPSEQLVAHVATAYRSSGTDIKKTLAALRSHPEFLAARRGTLRSPIEDAVHAARAMGVRPTGASKDSSFARHLIWMTDDMGQHQFRWPRPDGFPETSTAWASPARMLRSWDMHYSLSANWWGSTEISRHSAARVLPSTWPRTLAEVVEHQSRMLLGRTADPATLTAISTMLGRAPTRRYLKVAEVDSWHLAVIRGTILNSPEGMLR